MNEIQETSSYEDLVAESPSPPPYSVLESEQLIAQDDALAIPSTRTITHRIHWLSVCIGRTLQRIYPKLHHLNLRPSHKEGDRIFGPVKENLVSKFNRMASRIESLRLEIQDSMAQLAEMEEHSRLQRRHSI